MTIFRNIFKKPSARLFTIGPVQMFESTLKIKSKQLPYFRTTDFSNILENCDILLKELIGTGTSSKIMYLTCSGTGAMSATISNFISENDRVLIINSGNFGERFCEICRNLGVNFDEIKVPFNKNLDTDILSNYININYKAVFVTAHETSTGYLQELSKISIFCKKNNSLLIVDAITTFLCDRFQMDKLGIDIAIISSHKGLCISPGLAMAVINQKGLLQLKQKKSTDFYFDFNKYVLNLSNYQTPFTPAVGTILELEDILVKIKSQGLDTWLNKINRNAMVFRNSLDGRVSIPKHNLSNAITPIIFSDNIAKHMYKVLAEKYLFITNPTGGEFSETMLRISHVGNLCSNDFKSLNNAISIELNKII